MRHTRLNKEISFAHCVVRSPEAQMMLDYIPNQINGPFLLFVAVVAFVAAVVASSNGGKNKNLSLFQHLSFIAFANRPQYI